MSDNASEMTLFVFVAAILLRAVYVLPSDVYSCAALKDAFKRENIEEYHRSRCACVVPQEGLPLDSPSLELFQLEGDTRGRNYSFAEVAALPGYCICGKESRIRWTVNLNGDDDDVDCILEFTLLFTGKNPNVLQAKKMPEAHQITDLATFASPAGGMQVTGMQCSHDREDADVTIEFFYGEDFFKSRDMKWSCDDLPDPFITFDVAVTVKLNGTGLKATLTSGYASENIAALPPLSHAIVSASGLPCHLQNTHPDLNHVQFAFSDCLLAEVEVAAHIDRRLHGVVDVFLNTTHETDEILTVDTDTTTANMSGFGVGMLVRYVTTPASDIFDTDYFVAEIRTEDVDASMCADPTYVPPTESTPSSTTPRDDHRTFWEWAFIICASLILILIISLIAGCFVRQCRLRASAKLLMIQREIEARYQTREGRSYTRKDEWELDRHHIYIDVACRLGQGAFGNVYRGTVLGSASWKDGLLMQLNAIKTGGDYVAVKLLHVSSDIPSKYEFLREIELMKAIGYHERIVNMLFCVTVTEPYLLIMEYCMHGDLLSFLRERREAMLEAQDSTVSEEQSSPIPYPDTTRLISLCDQLTYAVEIAVGMDFLTSRGFIHRDLAARNIMVDRHGSCKIGDFGLCRKVEDNCTLYHSKGGKLPLKWMSPEAIENFNFSVASDVWSFGIVLFEIMTFGGVPYSDWPAAELLDRLERGERMDKPEPCEDDVYQVMQQCWAAEAGDRPMFSKLRIRLATILDKISNTTGDYYLRLDGSRHYYIMSKSANT